MDTTQKVKKAKANRTAKFKPIKEQRSVANPKKMRTKRPQIDWTKIQNAVLPQMQTSI